MSDEQTQGQVTTIDPFEGDDTEPTAYVKMDDRRKVAVELARELLGDKADEATPEEGILELRKANDPFYVTLKGSPRQVRRFGRDFKKLQPQGASKSARISKAKDLTEDLADARDALSKARKATEATEVREQLEAVKALADAMIDKIDAEDTDETDES